ncbi:MAG: hypothetical protein EXR54_06010 [Dehalococcoidia bacterium]|nr:hypothetical protein [Dehalococcoidia bacterium]MSQ17110.1 hypothetical protein [Dehalococcoidia bacterium]
MVQSNQDEAIKKLQSFGRLLLRYRAKLDEYLEDGDGDDSESASELRAMTPKVAKATGGVRPIVESIIGTRYIPGWGASNPWLEVLRYDYDQPTLKLSLDVLVNNVNETIGRLESKDLIDAITKPVQAQSIQRPKVFIAHDGESELRNTLEVECWRMMLEPVVAEEQVSRNESVGTNRVLKKGSTARNRPNCRI